MSEQEYMAVVMVGTPVSGFRIYGPFKNIADAEDWAGDVEDAEAWAISVEPLEDAQHLA